MFTIINVNLQQKPLNFFAFVAFFPQLVAGPIERACHFLPQFDEQKVYSYSKIVEGLRLILWGLFTKIVIADNFAIFVDVAFAENVERSGLTTLVGLFFFSFQIYADFSAYSNIAIGLAKTLGFNLKQNFQRPYYSSSLKEFWNRWHISLSTWFRDYVYIPLGGNRYGGLRTATNLLVTFLLSGLWHGANVTFLIWGGFHGVFLIIERFFNLKRSRFINRIITFIVVMLLWLPFRAEGTQMLLAMSKSILNFETYSLNHLTHIF